MQKCFFSDLIQSSVFYITDFKHLVPHSSAALVIISVLPGTGIWVDFFSLRNSLGLRLGQRDPLHSANQLNESNILSIISRATSSSVGLLEHFRAMMQPVLGRLCYT